MMGQALTKKDGRLAELVGAMKSDLRYAENAAGFDDELLKMLGWGGRRARVPQPAPGQVRLLVVKEQGDGCVRLQRKAPIEGGRAPAYRILRRQRPAGA